MRWQWFMIACLSASKSNLAMGAASAAVEPYPVAVAPQEKAAPSQGESSATPRKAATVSPAPAKGLVIPPVQVFRSLKDVYTSAQTPSLLMILHVPKRAGSMYVEIYNRTSQEISLLQFSVSALGHDGELEFDDLPPGWSAVKEVQLSSLRELAIRNARAFNADADEIMPRLEIHQIEAGATAFKIGKRRI